MEGGEEGQGERKGRMMRNRAWVRLRLVCRGKYGSGRLKRMKRRAKREYECVKRRKLKREEDEVELAS